MQPNLIINNLSPSKNFYLSIYKEIKALNKRLYIQIYRRPSAFIAGIIQPLLWMLLFAALFQNAPIILFNQNINYRDFLNPGIIIFTAFTGSMNAGLPVIFDREFGFLNRLLISPIKSMTCLSLSCLIHIWTITICQIMIIIYLNVFILHNDTITQYIYPIITLATLIIISISNISICLGFLLPGHIEFLAFMLIINLPILFSSTALAPLSFMPYWLQIITCINPLTYAIEILRYNYIFSEILPQNVNIANHQIISTLFIHLNTQQSIFILLAINVINFILVHYLITYKYE